MGPLGWQETVLIVLLALLIFGPKKLPELGKTLGKAMTEFRRASSELKGTWDREMAAIERESQSIKQETRKIGKEIAQSATAEPPPPDTHKYDSTYDYGYATDEATLSPEPPLVPEEKAGAAPNGDHPTQASDHSAETSTEVVDQKESKESATQTETETAEPTTTVAESVPREKNGAGGEAKPSQS